LLTALVLVVAYQAFLGERRAATMTLFLGCLGVIWLTWRRQRRLKSGLGLLVLLVAVTVALANSGSSTAFVRFRYLFGQTASRSVPERIEVFMGAVGRVATNPIFGAAYVPFDAGDPLENGILRIPSAHNFYLDLAQKAGVPALLLYIVLLVSASRLAFRAARTAEDPSLRAMNVTIAISFVLVCLISNQVQNTFSQLYPGIFLWTMIALCEIASRQPMRDPT
jgi:O-antigen ligase